MKSPEMLLSVILARRWRPILRSMAEDVSDPFWQEMAQRQLAKIDETLTECTTCVSVVSEIPA